MLPQRVPYPDGHLYQVTRRAETCTTACAPDGYFIPQSEEHLTPTVFQGAALVRGLSDLVQTRPGLRQPLTQSIVARKSMQAYTRRLSAAHSLSRK